MTDQNWKSFTKGIGGPSSTTRFQIGLNFNLLVDTRPPEINSSVFYGIEFLCEGQIEKFEAKKVVPKNCTFFLKQSFEGLERLRKGRCCWRRRIWTGHWQQKRWCYWLRRWWKRTTRRGLTRLSRFSKIFYRGVENTQDLLELDSLKFWRTHNDKLVALMYFDVVWSNCIGVKYF